jgi:hypothetical protein
MSHGERLLVALHGARPADDYWPPVPKAHAPHLDHARLVFSILRIGPAAEERCNAWKIV